MITNMDKLTENGCSAEKKDKVCRSRGGESCAFDGAMIVLQPIADAAHIVHGPIACCGNTWEGRGSFSAKGDLHKLGLTTDMNEIDIVYGSEEKLYTAIVKACATVRPKAVFVHATCVRGLLGEPDYTTDLDINLIGEYNIAGDLWPVVPVLKAAGIRIMARITGNASFEE